MSSFSDYLTYRFFDETITTSQLKKCLDSEKDSSVLWHEYVEDILNDPDRESHMKQAIRKILDDE